MLSEIFLQERGNIFTLIPSTNIQATIDMSEGTLTFHTKYGEVTTVFELEKFRYCRLSRTFYLHFHHPYDYSKLMIEIPRLSKRDQFIIENQILSISKILPKIGKIGYSLYINNTYKIRKN